MPIYVTAMPLYGRDMAAYEFIFRGIFYTFLTNFLRPMLARPIRPQPNKSIVAGSGTAAGGVKNTSFAQ